MYVYKFFYSYVYVIPDFQHFRKKLNCGSNCKHCYIIGITQ